MKRLKSITTPIFGFAVILMFYILTTVISTPEVQKVNDEPDSVIREPIETSSGQETESKKTAYELPPNMKTAKVDRVVDGDTFIALIDGKEVRVRLSGVDTPESVGDFKDNPEFYGQEASAFVREILWIGREVWLEEDEKTFDRYNRYLAYVWVENPLEGNFEEDCLNSVLIIEGYAEWFDDWDNTRYAEVFEGYEKAAQNKRIGLWQKR